MATLELIPSGWSALMGVGGRITIPPLWRTAWDVQDQRRPAREAPPIKNETAEAPAKPGILISIFLRDRPGILRAVVSALQPTPQAAEGRQVLWTIDGLLSSSLDGEFIIAMIVRPYNDAAINKDELLESMEAQVESATRIFWTPDEPKGTSVLDFVPHGDELFHGRVFGEYRFTYRPQSQREAATTLGLVAKQVANLLAESGVPIAYLFFPDRWTLGSDEQVLRIGIGVPPRAMELFEVDLSATSIARRQECGFQKYDANRNGVSLTDRFATIHSPNVSDHATETTEPHRQDFDAVFVEGEARAGFVAKMLECTPELLSGTMTVLRGHTLACWMVPAGEGPAVGSAIENARQ